MRELLFVAATFLLLEPDALFGQAASSAAEIRVVVLNYKTGRPLAGRYIALVLLGPDGEYPNHAGAMTSKSGADGIAVFRFIAAPPPVVSVVALDDYECSKEVDFSTAEILQRGIAGEYADDNICKPHVLSAWIPKPGQIVFPIHRLNILQRIWRGLL